MEFRNLDLVDMNVISVLEVLDHNRRVAQFKRREIKRLKSITVTSTNKKIVNVIQSTVVKNDKRSEEKEKVFSEEVEYYLSDLLGMSVEELTDDIDSVIPSRNNVNYTKIMNRMMAEILKDIKDYNELVVEDTDLSKNELIEIRNEIINNKKKIELISSKLNETEDVKEEREENTLFFVPTPNGDVRLLKDLGDVNEDQYEEFSELIKSIIDGTFKNAKKLVGNYSISRISEVRGDQTRVFYRKLGKNKYAVLGALTKKTDSNSAYRNTLENIIKNFESYEKKMRDNSNKEAYIEENKKIQEQVFMFLGGEKSDDKTRTDKSM